MQKDKFCIVITGCIEPSEEVPKLYLSNKNERKEQYVKALKFYIERTFIKNIIYCDNSGIKEVEMLNKSAKKNNKNFECLFFKGNSFNVIKKGKGYGEGEILEYVINNSYLIKNMNYIVKITGRLIIKNIDFIMRFSKEKNYFFPITVRFGKKFVDTRFYIVSKEDYEKYLLKAYVEVDDNNLFFLEHAFAKNIISNRMTTSLFTIEPNIMGISGSNGKRYHSSWLKILIKSILNRMKISIDLIKHKA